MSTTNANVATGELREHATVSRDELMTLDDHELRDMGPIRANFGNEPNGSIWTLAISGGLIPPRLSTAHLIEAPRDAG